MKKILLLLFPLCGIAAAQTYTGEHYTGATCPESPNGETGCNYVGNITGDAYAAYASITDTTGANFPAYYPRWMPPTIDAENTPWNATITWRNGAQVTGTTTVTNGTCTTKGAPVPTRTLPFAVSPVSYTVTCSGIDSNGNLASKVHIYRVYFETGRGGGFWQPPQDGTGTTTFTAIGAAPPVMPPAAQTYTGEHYTGAACQSSPDGETSCAYVGNITNDPYAAYAWITDTTGADFPAISPRGKPPTLSLTGVWSATIAWNNGGGVTGTTTVQGGVCTVTGGPRGYSATYTVSCSGTDSNGNPASKTHFYYVYFKTSRAGGFWQQPQDGTGITTFTTIGAAPPVQPAGDIGTAQ